MKKRLISNLFCLTLLTLFSVPTYAFDWGENVGETESNDIFTVIEFDEHQIPLAGYYNKKYVASAKNNQDVKDYLKIIGREDAENNLIYIRNGYGGPYISGGNVAHPTSWSFNILMPYTAYHTPKEQEQFAYQYIPLNRLYKAGGQSKSAYGYANGVNSLGFSNIQKGTYDGQYTLKYVSSDPASGTLYPDNTGHIEMTSKNKVVDGKTKPFWGEYRFNGVSGNGERMMQQVA